MIVNAIRACDDARLIVSGVHSLELEGVWNIQDQGEITDILTPHPYPFWVEHCLLTPLDDFRTLLHATAQTEYYASVGGKPCLVEELGSMGPMVCDEEKAAGVLTVNVSNETREGFQGSIRVRLCRNDFLSFRRRPLRSAWLSWSRRISTGCG